MTNAVEKRAMIPSLLFPTVLGGKYHSIAGPRKTSDVKAPPAEIAADDSVGGKWYREKYIDRMTAPTARRMKTAIDRRTAGL